MISTKQTEIASAIEATNKQMVEVNAKLGALQLAGRDEDETEVDRSSAISQTTAEQIALDISRKLLQELLSRIQVTAATALGSREAPRNVFGNLERGFQVETNYGGISGITFN
jgi:hypothetical protein